MKRAIITVLAAVGLTFGLTGCDYLDSGIVRDHELRIDRYTTEYWLQIEKAVSHDADARHWVQVDRIQYIRCDYGEEWIKANVGGCDARVRDNPPGW
jgi:hypothetical protein